MPSTRRAERVLAEVQTARRRGRGRWSGRSAACSPRTCRAGLTCPRSTARRWTASPLVAGPAAELPVVGESRAGHPFPSVSRRGTAVRISTGAVVPEGADAVVPVERTEEAGERVRVPELEPGTNIRRAGEDVRAGELVLRAGARAGAGGAGGGGVDRAAPRLRCAARPRVALVVTGDELVRPGEPLGPGRIYSSNGVRAGRPGGARRRRARSRARARPTPPRPRAARWSGRSPGPTWSASRAACRSARTTTCAARWRSSAWRSASGA